VWVLERYVSVIDVVLRVEILCLSWGEVCERHGRLFFFLR
jgi:hypothetical protein